MEDSKKSEILMDIKNKDVDMLWDYIKNDEITLEEMKNTGFLRRDIRLALESRLQNLEIEFWNECFRIKTLSMIYRYKNKYPNGIYITKCEELIKEIEGIEKDIWEQCVRNYTPISKEITLSLSERNLSLKESLNSFIRYKQAYPEGIYISMCNTYISEIHARIARQKAKILLEMQEFPDNYTKETVKALLDSQIIEDIDMIDRGIITQKALRLYLNPPSIEFMDQQLWINLPPIPKGKTDVYFFGIPGSGKSCVLAGMLYLANKKGILEPDISSPFGFRYLNELCNCIRIGYVPKPTNTDTVNYVSFNLKDNKIHPLTVIEMSGELFRNTYNRVIGIAGEKPTIGAKDYLKNSNRKAIFFVIDYHASFSDNIEISASQQDMLTGVLLLLAQDGTLAKTDTIQIIISKSDYMPENEERKISALMFLNEHYYNFMVLVEDMCKKFNINKPKNYKPVIIPFSLGRFMLGRTFEYNPDDSLELVKSLLHLTSTKQKESFWE